MREKTKSLGNKLAYEVRDWKLRAANAVLLGGVGLGPMTTKFAFAEVNTALEGDLGTDTSEASNLVQNLISPIVGLFPLIGGVILIAGAMRLLLAYRNNQPDEYSSAAKDIIIGAVFIVFKTIFWDKIIKPVL